MLEKIYKNTSLKFFVGILVFSAFFVTLLGVAQASPYLTARYAKMKATYLTYKATVVGERSRNLIASVVKNDEKPQEPEADQAKSIPILLYHGIVGGADSVNVTKNQFKRQMFALKEAGYNTVSLEDFHSFATGKKNVPEKSFLLTFDDGRKDSYYNADPVLQALNYRAVMFTMTSSSITYQNNFYLKKSELQQMFRTGRWELGSFGRRTHETAQVSATGTLGSFLGNKIWREIEKRLETGEEYEERIREDLEDAKKDLEREFYTHTLAFALPHEDVADHMINMKDAKEKIVENASEVYDIVFHETWPRMSDGFKNAYPKREDPRTTPKRIQVTPNWQEEELVQILESARDITLPYEEQFNNPWRWNNISGEKTIEDKALSLRGKEGNATMYLDGSVAWKDYEFKIGVTNLTPGSSISLMARYKTGGDYVACQFENKAVLLKRVRGYKEKTVLESVKVPKEYTARDGAILKIRVENDHTVQCFVNESPILISKNVNVEREGGVGVKIWNPKKQEIHTKIQSMSVIPLEAEDEASGEYAYRAGREIAYLFLDQGDIKSADELLKDVYKVERFKPVSIPNITWRENPFGESYWRFGFYSLDFLRHLLFAWRKTGNDIYRQKIEEVIKSFATKGTDEPYSWDYHGTAFRTMMLVNVWGKLQQAGALSEEMKGVLSKTLEAHGKFLADETHYEGDYNHGLDQAAALYVLALNFPNMLHAKEWRPLAETRLKKGAEEIIDSNGILVENSPFYHFYVLEKYWDVYKYLKRFNLSIGYNLEEKIKKMISYGAYILQPDREVPTIGGSISRAFKLRGPYEEMARLDPEFAYALTAGNAGRVPSKRNTVWDESGQVIMRSLWGKGEEFKNQTQLVFDAGPYRTDHSDMDALSFHLFGKGVPLMPDAGLYTFEPGPYRAYFHGTRAHNTVVVDGLDQLTGSGGGKEKGVSRGKFFENEDVSYQSASHNLYSGVLHERTAALLGDSLVLIVDDLRSDDEHKYEQLFHLFPGAKVITDGLTVSGKGTKTEEVVTIHQLKKNRMEVSIVEGEVSPPRGLCSKLYETAIPCPEISYSIRATSTVYITLIEIGNPDKTLKASADDLGEEVTIEKSGKKYSIRIGEAGEFRRREINVDKKYDLEKLRENWVLVPGVEKLKIVAPKDGSVEEMKKNITLDLSKKNIALRIKVKNRKNARKVEIMLSNNNFEKTAALDLKSDIYNASYEDEWLMVGLSKGKDRDESFGNWVFEGGEFDWSKIDGMKLRVMAKEGQDTQVSLDGFWAIPAEKNARIVLIFDDGWASVKEALPIMKKYGVKGNIGMITGSVGSKNYLSLEDLKEFQNVYGWDIVNHSSLHKDAVKDYYESNNLAGYEKDIADALVYLEENKINSAPNWYIYPNGSMNSEIKNIIGKYYKFARGTQDLSEAFPFADPLSVKIMSVYSGKTTPENVRRAIKDAVAYKQTLFLMFHKIEGETKLHTEYSPEDLEEILESIATEGAKVVTLSEFDAENDISPTKFSIEEETLPHLVLEFK